MPNVVIAGGGVAGLSAAHELAKKPGFEMEIEPRTLSFNYAATNGELPDAYEKILFDCIRGDQTLFMRGDEVEAAWAWTDPIINGWEAREDKPKPYEPGSTGPEEARILLHKDERRWRELRA